MNRTYQIRMVVLLLLGLLLAGSGQTIAAEEIVKAQAAWSLDRAQPGDQLALAVVVEIEHPYHINPEASQIPPTLDYLIPTKLKITSAGSQLEVGAVQYPSPESVTVRYSGEPKQLVAYAGRLVFYVPVVVRGDVEPGQALIDLELNYQACDDQTCLRPQKLLLQAKLEIVPRGTPTQRSGDQNLFAGFDSSQFATVAANVAQGTPIIESAERSAILANDFFGRKFELDTDTGLGLALVLLVAMVAGVLLNFTPCVLPVIPLKVMSLHHQATLGRRVWVLGLIYAGGIVSCFVALGVLVAGLIEGLERLEWGQIFSYWPVSVGLAAVMVIMSLGLLGLFTIRLPQRLYMLSPSAESPAGNFALGVLTAVLSTPCTGPMLGATIAWAVKQPPWLSLLCFALMGVGMALPYVVLTLKPGWLARMPRSGPGSELVKQTMGLLLLAVAGFFLGPVIPGKSEWYVVVIAVVVAMGWMIYRTFRLTSRVGVRTWVSIGGLATCAAALLLTLALTAPGPIPWQPYSGDAFASAQQQGKTILVEFTADWCGNCKALELTTYRDPKLARLFNERDDHIAFQVDLTSQDNEEGWARQRQLGGGGGIPLAAVYHRGQADPVQVFQGLFTPDQLLVALQAKP